MHQKQAIGVLLICVCVAIVAALMTIVPRCSTAEKEPSSLFSLDSVMTDSLERQWQAAHPVYEKKEYKKKTYPKYRKDTVPLRMQLFDPNTADSITLLEVGLKPWQAKGILHYRAKGGRYSKPEDMRKLYGMTDSMYSALEPWIQIAPLPLDTASQTAVYRPAHEKRDTILEINSADTASLQFIRGVGPYYAKQIVRYRDKLGGYVSLSQLAEIKNLPIDSLLPHLTLDASRIRLIDINRSTVSTLVRHPYISYDQAKAIEDLAHKRTIRSAEDLTKKGIFTEAELQRLLPYLQFEDGRRSR